MVHGGLLWSSKCAGIRPNVLGSRLGSSRLRVISLELWASSYARILILLCHFQRPTTETRPGSLSNIEHWNHVILPVSHCLPLPYAIGLCLLLHARPLLFAQLHAGPLSLGNIFQQPNLNLLDMNAPSFIWCGQFYPLSNCLILLGDVSEV